MTARNWRVVGGSGFAGSAITARLEAQGHAVQRVSAPRLSSSARTVHHLMERARDLESVIDYLADSFAGADVVVNAAGMAQPDGSDQDALVGANALLPLLILAAAERTGATRVIHLSTAAVQGSADCLDETEQTDPFSPYSFSKALAERALLRVLERDAGDRTALPELVLLRATSVQGRGRRTTRRLARFAGSPFSSVAGAGTAHTPVTSVEALAELVETLGTHEGELPRILLQPWEGATTASILRDAGRREPRHLPAVLCRAALSLGHLVSSAAGSRWHGALRRIEVTWFGQQQVPGWVQEHGLLPAPAITPVLRAVHTDQAG
ncbi:NAD(P)-dependent oxidoreductase [Kocuria palustris]|uniref:NAD-dependent epimerase/dehydratase family protein n=1 Tax=Kocuria palustris TaxID=71999 RepID=UPI0011A3F5DE|nr:NAD-dependent epimerase/dehydratase family protein [Kocuria palustris]